MSHLDISDAFMRLLADREHRDIGPIDSVAIAYAVIRLQQAAIEDAHNMGYLTKQERNTMLDRLADSIS